MSAVCQGESDKNEGENLKRGNEDSENNEQPKKMKGIFGDESSNKSTNPQNDPEGNNNPDVMTTISKNPDESTSIQNPKDLIGIHNNPEDSTTSPNLGESPTTCQFCGKSFSNQHNVIRHIKLRCPVKRMMKREEETLRKEGSVAAEQATNKKIVLYIKTSLELPTKRKMDEINKRIESAKESVAKLQLRKGESDKTESFPKKSKISSTSSNTQPVVIKLVKIPLTKRERDDTNGQALPLISKVKDQSQIRIQNKGYREPGSVQGKAKADLTSRENDQTELVRENTKTQIETRKANSTKSAKGESKVQSANSQRESSSKFVLDSNPNSTICNYCGNKYSSVQNVKRHINLRCPVVKKMSQK